MKNQNAQAGQRKGFRITMLDEIFILILYLPIAFTFRWAFQTLPGEKWQILGSIPCRRLPDGRWQGWNLTWYGFFNATAVLLSTTLFLILMGSIPAPLHSSLLILSLLLATCLPAARITAFLIEKKSNTFTVGGASFIGILIAPWMILVVNLASLRWFGTALPVIETLAAISIAYTLGEGVGRLACISFGCCYGKLLADCSPGTQRLFSRYHFIFTGKTKKIAYAHELDGQKVVPIQAITATLYSISGLIGCYLFLKGFAFSAFILTLLITQTWRIISESLRADYRGDGTISGYQIMSAVALIYVLPVGFWFREPFANVPALPSGLTSLWNPTLLLFLLTLWIVVLIYMGKSKVTSAVITFQVIKDKI